MRVIFFRKEFHPRLDNREKERYNRFQSEIPIALPFRSFLRRV